jgi:uncharacterized membrane protein YdjX (TVP38/TMEM64 family)
MPSKARAALGRLGWILGISFGAFIVLAMSSMALASGDWLFGIGLLLVALLLYWWIDERDSTETAAATANRVADRSEGLVGNVVSGGTALIVGLTGAVLVAGDVFLDTINFLVAQALGRPFVTIMFTGVGSLFSWGPQFGLADRTVGLLVVVLIVVVALLRHRIIGVVGEGEQ